MVTRSRTTRAKRSASWPRRFPESVIRAPYRFAISAKDGGPVFSLGLDAGLRRYDGCGWPHRSALKDVMERPDRRRRPVRMVPDRAADGEEVGSRLDQHPAILRRDAADRDAGDLEQGRPPAEDRRVGP